MVGGEVHGDVDVAGLKLDLLRGGLGDVAEDDAVDGGRFAPVVFVAHEHGLDRGFPGFEHIGAAAGRVAVQPFLGSVGGGGVFAGGTTLSLDLALVHDAEGVEDKLGQDGRIGLRQRQDDGLVVGRFDRGDGLGQEGGVAGQVLEPVEAEDHVPGGNGIAVREGRSVLQA